MNDNIFTGFIIFAIIIIILFGIFAYNAIDNLGDSLDSQTYKKSYMFKGVGYFIYSIVLWTYFC